MDHVSQWLANHFFHYYDQFIGRRLKKEPYSGAQIYNYNDKHLQRPVKVLTTAVSSLLPIVSTLTLHFVQSVPARLGVTAEFMVLFSGTLALLTDSRLGDIFAATAA